MVSPEDEMTEPRRRKPSPQVKARASLDRDKILTNASELIEQVGLPAFSMRSLALRLGVEAMSLYHYYPSKAHLFDALLDGLLETLPPFDDALPWVKRIRVRAFAFRRAMLLRPAFATFVLTHRFNTRTALAFIDEVAELFMVGHRSTELAARQFRAFNYYLAGALLDETAGYSHGPTAADPVPLDEQQRIASSLLAFGPFFAPEHWERTFEYGLDMLLVAFERERRRARRG